MLGEPQILGQLKQAYQQAAHLGTIGTELQGVFQQVFSASKAVRSRTQIGVNAVSVAYAAVQLAKRIFSDFQQTRVLLIGAGETIELVAKHFKAHGVEHFTIANRRPEKAALIAEPLSGKAIALSDISTELANADIVISATASQLPILGKGLVERVSRERKHRPMLLVDLAVPRDIEPEVSALSDVYLYNVDDLQSIVQTNQTAREQAVNLAECIIEQAVYQYDRWQRSLLAVDSIKTFRTAMQKKADELLVKSLADLERGEAPEKLMKKLTHTLVNSLMHQPTTRLRKAGYDGREDLIALANHLFKQTES